MAGGLPDEPGLPTLWPAVRLADPGAALSIALLLHDCHRELGEPVPEPGELAMHLRDLLDSDAITVLLAEGEGLVVLRFQPSLLSGSLDCHVEELYVVPARRRCGIGTALLTAALGHARERGGGHAYVGPGVEDIGARALYEGLGFSHRGAASSSYERGL
jgi:GNAT superfamily N-acetyltransferase